MATKLKALKLLQETRTFAEFTNRRPPPRTPGLFLLQMRSHLLQVAATREKRTIHIAMQPCPEIPLPIKIKHLTVRPTPSGAPCL